MKLFHWSQDIRSKLTWMKSDSKQHNDTFDFFPLYGAEFGQFFPFFVTCRKIDSESKAIAMRLFVFTRKWNSRQPVWFPVLDHRDKLTTVVLPRGSSRTTRLYRTSLNHRTTAIVLIFPCGSGSFQRLIVKNTITKQQMTVLFFSSILSILSRLQITDQSDLSRFQTSVHWIRVHIPKLFIWQIWMKYHDEVDLFCRILSNKTFKSEEISDFQTTFSEIQRSTSILRICETFVHRC